MKSKFLRSVIIIFLFFGCISLFPSCAKKEKIQEMTLTKNEVYNRLEKLSYEPIQVSGAFFKKLCDIPVKQETEVSAEQIQELLRCVQNMFLGFNLGNVKSYKNFRMPEQVKWQMSSMYLVTAVNEWRKDNHYSGKEDFLEEDQLLEWYIGKHTAGKYYKNFWRGICLEKLNQDQLKYLGTPLTCTNYGMTIYTTVQYKRLADKLRPSRSEQWNWIWEFLYLNDLKFREDIGARQVLNQDKKLICADGFFFVLREEPYKIRPMYITFYWNTHYNMWIPMDFALGKFSNKMEKFEEIYELF